MRAFLAGVAAMVLIAVAAMVLLDGMDRSTAELYQSPSGSVRL